VEISQQVISSLTWMGAFKREINQEGKEADYISSA
jgi:hypothetical protein